MQQQREAAVSVELQIENEIRGLSNRAMHLSNGKHSVSPNAIGGGSGSMMRLQKDRNGSSDFGRDSLNDCGATALKPVTNDTASGSTNSLWSKSSSSNNNTNADGPKMFETFNRNLIKSIKVSTFIWMFNNLSGQANLVKNKQTSQNALNFQYKMQNSFKEIFTIFFKEIVLIYLKPEFYLKKNVFDKNNILSSNTLIVFVIISNVTTFYFHFKY